MRAIEYTERNCDCCESNDVEPVFTYSTKARTRGTTFVWNVVNVVCRRCGFAFVSPVPTTSSLTEYYADSYPYWQGEVSEFSSSKRLSLLRRHIHPGSRSSFIEIGSNATDAFREASGTLIEGCKTVELNSNCGADFDNLRSVPGVCADILGAYFVLEHIPDPGNFLGECWRILKPDGILIVEVPNLYVYPILPAGLFLHEHTNHFSPRSLSLLAENHGLETVDISYQYCSRPFGFAAVFRKAPRVRGHGLITESDYHLAKACILEGTYWIKKYHAQLAAVRKRVEAAAARGRPIVFWAANRCCWDLLDGFDIPPGAVFVDSDVAKKDYLERVPVHHPDDVPDALSSAGLFVINSSLHSSEIVESIRKRTGRVVGREETIIVEPGYQFFSGDRVVGELQFP